jgi:HlyD family secretion protein
MLSRYRPLAALFALTCSLAPSLPRAQETKPGDAQAAAPAAEAPSKTPMIQLAREPFEVKVALKGLFESAAMAEVVLRPQAWSQLSVLEAVGPGRWVQKDERLVSLDTRRIDEAIRDAETALETSALAIRQAEEDLKLLDGSLPLDLAAAKQALDLADQDLMRFLKIGRPLSEKSAEFAFKSAQDSLEYQLEELRQLERMYKADDLTEETEEIVLRRQRDQVERARFAVETARVQRDRVLEVDLPRQEETLKAAARRQMLLWEKAQHGIPTAVNQKRLELEKMKAERARAEERLAKLRQDRKAMTVLSPAAGVVYYGACDRGRWRTAGAMAAKLRQGGSLQEHEVFMTIADPKKLLIRATFPERELHQMQLGLDARATPSGFPHSSLPAKILALSAIPVEGEEFEAVLEVELGDGAPALMPGMTCALQVTAYSAKEALALPPAALFGEREGDSREVYVKSGAGHEKRRVRIGRQNEGKVEVLEGLEEGDVVFLAKPE